MNDEKWCDYMIIQMILFPIFSTTVDQLILKIYWQFIEAISPCCGRIFIEDWSKVQFDGCLLLGDDRLGLTIYVCDKPTVFGVFENHSSRSLFHMAEKSIKGLPFCSSDWHPIPDVVSKTMVDVNSLVDATTLFHHFQETLFIRFAWV